ncbi:ribonuclease Z [Flavobacterium paronense]|uniref:Ribonuclease Z n=1 Tax=Flavobacterium paronense TaxID=1392775 RepID=A0ABV5GG42_9FLAO|nr:ribonuclease Z [Flavobacterium paronense]MDN3676962.1 ribonuclease Z [Flavobacterium paronense]
MKVEKKGHTTTIRNTQGSTAEFYQKLHHEYNSFKSQNIIVDLSNDKALTMDDIKLFTEMIKIHSKEKKSLVLVNNSVNFNTVPKNIMLVPTILEAHDIIEMEEIERDLGF